MWFPELFHGCCRCCRLCISLFFLYLLDVFSFRCRRYHARVVGTVTEEIRLGVTITEGAPHYCPMILPSVFEAIARCTILRQASGQTQLEAEALKALPSKQVLILQLSGRPWSTETHFCMYLSFRYPNVSSAGPLLPQASTSYFLISQRGSARFRRFC